MDLRENWIKKGKVGAKATKSPRGKARGEGAIGKFGVGRGCWETGKETDLGCNNIWCYYYY